MQPADAPSPEAEEGQGLAPRTAGMLQLSPQARRALLEKTQLMLPLSLPLTLPLTQAWRALLEETQIMLRSGEGMHAPGVCAGSPYPYPYP